VPARECSGVSGELSGARGRGRRGRLLGIGAVLLVASLAGAAALHRLQQVVATRDAFPLENGRIAAPGITAPVEIHRDDRGIPHVEATTEDDAFFGLGFVHAQDRLGQMLWLVRLARGRSAEILGPEGLPSDRLARTLDLGGLADAQFEHLDAATRKRVVAYARGVNARIRRIREGRADSPAALRGAPGAIEDWRPSDSLAVLKLYSWGLEGSFDARFVLSDLIEHLGGFGARRFFPGIPNLPDTPFRPPVTAGVPRAGGEDPLRAAAGLRGRAIGSTAWVVGGAQTESGAPILVADAHLETTAPSLFYVAHFRGGDLDVAGSTIPGIPAVWTGLNGNVAWASTHARAVTTDLYEEKLGAADEARYFDGVDWRELGRRAETLEVRGAEDEELVVHSTHHGPLISGLVEGEREPLALAWTGARVRGRSGIASLLEVARARDEAELRKALAGHEDPPLAVVYAAADGSAGKQVAGWIPSRALPSRLMPLPGRARWYDWRGRIDFDELPRHRLRSGAGWAIAADDPLASAKGGERVEWLWRSGIRARRIDALLRAAVADGPVDLREMTALQNDIAMERAHELIAIALSFTEAGESLGAEGRDIVGLLRAWDARADAASVGAAAYHVFLESLTRRLLEPTLGEELLERYLALPQADPDQVVFEIVRDAAAGGEVDGWSDPESVAAAVRESAREAWFSLSFRLGANRSKWHWGRLHQLAFRPFRPGARGARGAAGLGPFAYGGSAATVSAAEYDRTDPFAVRVASTFRFAVDSSALDHALITLAPGQSEHPGHPTFDDAVPRWREGRLHLLATAPLFVEESSRALLVLEPAP
jgi:penicillin amidase